MKEGLAELIFLVGFKKSHAESSTLISPMDQQGR